MSGIRTCIAVAVLTIAIALTLLPAYASLIPDTIGFGGYNTNTPTQNYAGAAKVVLQIESSVSSDAMNDYTPSYFNVNVLYSNDSAIKAGSNYKLVVYIYGIDYFGEGPTLPEQFTPGTIIGINDYTFDGSTITVSISATYKETEAGTEWKQKITILSGGMDMDSLQLNPESPLSSSSTPTMTLGNGNSLFNMFSTSPLKDNSGRPTTSTSSGNTIASGLSLPFGVLSNAFSPFGNAKMFGSGGLI